ncbi:unnamed protein product [Protopolystoma xenopodis]|uniref:Uncharacterized protein n=1 Tax=Protopolystoma xenopodis TaxID=117903 RepID=A0A448XD98_9PLAT|nr:unnamed protein product [Protopolystoma xenopodis]
MSTQSKATEEYRHLMSENIAIQSEVDVKNQALQAARDELANQRSELERLRQEHEKIMSYKQEKQPVSTTSAAVQAENSFIDIEISSNSTSLPATVTIAAGQLNSAKEEVGRLRQSVLSEAITSNGHLKSGSAVSPPLPLEKPIEELITVPIHCGLLNKTEDKIVKTLAVHTTAGLVDSEILKNERLDAGVASPFKNRKKESNAMVKAKGNGKDELSKNDKYDVYEQQNINSYPKDLEKMKNAVVIQRDQQLDINNPGGISGLDPANLRNLRLKPDTSDDDRLEPIKDIEVSRTTDVQGFHKRQNSSRRRRQNPCKERPEDSDKKQSSFSKS